MAQFQKNDLFVFLGWKHRELWSEMFTPEKGFITFTTRKADPRIVWIHKGLAAPEQQSRSLLTPADVIRPFLATFRTK